MEQPSSFGFRERHTVHAIGILLTGDERLMQFLFHHKHPRLRAPADELLDEAKGFSHGERLLIQVALDLWCGHGGACLPELLSTLDNRLLLRVLQAITYDREMVEVYEALQCCEY